MIVYDVLICKSPEQTDTCYFPMMLHVYTITFWESLVIVGIWDFQSCVNWMVISALEQCLLLLFWIVCQWMENNLFDHRCAVHLFTIHFVFVHKCLAFSSKLGRTFFFSLFSFKKKKKKSELGYSKTAWKRFEHLIFHSSVASAFGENSSPSLTPLTSDFQIPCMLSPHGSPPLPPS